jgi:hypothetical protein
MKDRNGANNLEIIFSSLEILFDTFFHMVTMISYLENSVSSFYR